MADLKPGWADLLAPAVKTGDEATRAEALGVKPRRNFRIDRTRMADSARRGGQLGRKSQWGTKKETAK